MQLLHYMALNSHALHAQPSNSKTTEQERFMDHAEFLLFYSQSGAADEDDISRTSVRCTNLTSPCP